MLLLTLGIHAITLFLLIISALGSLIRMLISSAHNIIIHGWRGLNGGPGAAGAHPVPAQGAAVPDGVSCLGGRQTVHIAPTSSLGGANDEGRDVARHWKHLQVMTSNMILLNCYYFFL